MSLPPFCLIAVIITALILGAGHAEGKKHTSDDSAWTGEPSPSPHASTTNAVPASIAAPITNAALIAPTTNQATPVPPSPSPRHTASLSISDLREYEAQPLQVKQLIARALALTDLDLSYQYGSSDPKNGGMDCSGTVYYLLVDAGLKDVPRDASGIYKWVWTRSRFQAVNSSNLSSFEFASLKPGDLLFWVGTYQVERDPPISHVMIYLGINRHSGHRVMVGASEGRYFDGKPQYGVSVFDFTLPSTRSKDSSSEKTSTANNPAHFVGYGTIPGFDKVDEVEKP